MKKTSESLKVRLDFLKRRGNQFKNNMMEPENNNLVISSQNTTSQRMGIFPQ